MKKTGFSIIEIVVVIAIFTILGIMSVTALVLFGKNADLNNAAKETVNTIKLAQSKTLASRDNSQYGVYFNTAASPNNYTIFKGNNYSSRDVSADEIFLLPAAVEFYDINLGASNEIIFQKLTGAAENSGSISLRLKANTSKNKTIYVSSSGVVGFVLPPVASDDARLKDFRHAHINYNSSARPINTANEIISLTFDGGTVVKQIPISDNLVGSDFYWQEDTTVGGSIQTIKIHTHFLNSPTAPFTQFCIHRNPRYNNKSLKVTISGDTGSIAEYSAGGTLTALSSPPYSIYVTSVDSQ